jgi:hypothetical protein
MASGRSLSPRRLHRRQHVGALPKMSSPSTTSEARASNGLRTRRRDRMDTAVMSVVRCQRGSSSASRIRYNLGNFLRTLATPETTDIPQREVHYDRREGRQPLPCANSRLSGECQLEMRASSFMRFSHLCPHPVTSLCFILTSCSIALDVPVDFPRVKFRRAA